MKKVTQWEAEDGTLHNTRREALDHELRAKLVDFIAPKILSYYSEAVTDVAEVLIQHKNDIVRILNGAEIGE